MEPRIYYFLQGERAVEIYQWLNDLTKMTDKEHAILVNYGSLDSFEVDEQTKQDDLISMVIEMHNGWFDIQPIPKEEYEYLKQRGVM